MITELEVQNLFSNHINEIKSNIRVCMPNQEQSEELYNKVYSLAMIARNEYNKKVKFTKWINSLVKIQIRENFHNNASAISENVCDELLINVPEFFKGENGLNLLKSRLIKLTINAREIMTLYYSKNISVVKISKQLKQSVHAVKASLKRSRKLLVGEILNCDEKILLKLLDKHLAGKLSNNSKNLLESYLKHSRNSREFFWKYTEIHHILTEENINFFDLEVDKSSIKKPIKAHQEANNTSSWKGILSVSAIATIAMGAVLFYSQHNG